MEGSFFAPLQPAGEIHGSSAEPHGRSTFSRTRASTNRALTTLSATEARKRLYALIDEVGDSHEPVQITGKRSNAVLLSEDDWRAIQETLHLVSIPPANTRSSSASAWPAAAGRCGSGGITPVPWWIAGAVRALRAVQGQQ